MIEVRGLKKTFDGFAALDGADLSVPRGAVYGLVGPNGAGKTTLLRHLTGVYHQDSGSVTFDGQPVWENQEALNHICFSRELQATLFSGPNNLKIKHYLRSAAIYYPNWDGEYAQQLLEALYGEHGRHARSAIGVGSLPTNASVEIEIIAEKL